MPEVLFPRTLEHDASEQEFVTQHELAHWTVSALETALHKEDITREAHGHLIQEYNQVHGTTLVLTQQGIDRGYIEPTME